MEEKGLDTQVLTLSTMNGVPWAISRFVDKLTRLPFRLVSTVANAGNKKISRS